LTTELSVLFLIIKKKVIVHGSHAAQAPALRGVQGSGLMALQFFHIFAFNFDKLVKRLISCQYYSPHLSLYN